MLRIMISLVFLVGCSFNADLTSIDQSSVIQNETPASPSTDPIQIEIPQEINCNISPSVLDSKLNSSSVQGQSVFASGTLAFLGTTSSTPGTQNGIQIVDAQNPNSLTNLSFISTDSGPGKIDGSMNDVLDIFVEGSYLYATTYGGGLLIVDISNPQSPVVTGKLNLDFETWAVAKKGNYVYIGNKNAGLQIVNVSNPFSPQLIGTFSSMSLTHIQIEGNLIYGSTVNAIKIIDITNPTAPQLRGSVAVNDNTAYEIYYQNNYLYAIDKPNKTIKTYDVSDPTNLTLLSTTNPETLDFRSIIGYKDKLFVASGTGSLGKLYIFDIKTPYAPTLTNTVDLSNRGMEVSINNGIVYTANLDGKIQSIKVCQ